VPSQDVHMSVCPSVTRQYSVETVKHILKLFSASGSYTILVFPYQTPWHFRRGVGKTLTGASNAMGMKSRDFWPISRFISEVIQDTVITTEGEYRKPYTQPFQWYHFEWPFSDLEWLSEIFNDEIRRGLSVTSELLVRGAVRSPSGVHGGSRKHFLLILTSRIYLCTSLYY